MAKTDHREAAAPAPPGEITRLLLAWRQGDREALERLIPLVYGELHRSLSKAFFHRELSGSPS